MEVRRGPTDFPGSLSPRSWAYIFKVSAICALVRRATVPLLLGLLLLAAAAPTATVQADDEGETPTSPADRVSGHTAVGYAVDVWKDEVVWASEGENSVEFRVGNLSSGEETVLTEVADPDGELEVDSLAYDGRWLVWSDDRFGHLQTFAFDTRNETLTRLSDSEQDALGADLSGGFSVWLEGRDVWLARAETGKAEAYREKTAAVAPRIVGSNVLWARIHGTNTTLHLDDLDAETVEEIVTVTDGGIAASALSANRVAWAASHLEIEDTEVTDIEDFTLETVRLDGEGTPEEAQLLHSAETIGEVATTDEWVAWKQSTSGRPGPALVTHVPSGDRFSLAPAAMGGLSASPSYVAFVGADEATDRANRIGGHVYAAELVVSTSSSGAIEGSTATWIMVGGGLALVGLGLSWGRLRRFIDR